MGLKPEEITEGKGVVEAKCVSEPLALRDAQFLTLVRTRGFEIGFPTVLHVPILKERLRRNVL